MATSCYVYFELSTLVLQIQNVTAILSFTKALKIYHLAAIVALLQVAHIGVLHLSIASFTESDAVKEDLNGCSDGTRVLQMMRAIGCARAMIIVFHVGVVCRFGSV